MRTLMRTSSWPLALLVALVLPLTGCGKTADNDASQTPSGTPPADTAPADNAPADAPPADSAPAGDAPTEKPPAEKSGDHGGGAGKS